MNWQMLTRALEDKDEKLIRHPCVEERYRKYKQDMKEKGYSLHEHIIDIYFSGRQSNDTFHIAPNDFPYWLAPGIDHLVGWVNPNVEVGDDWKDALLSIVAKQYKSAFCRDHVKWKVNTLENMTVPEIKHMHIFIHRQSELNKI